MCQAAGYLFGSKLVTGSWLGQELSPPLLRIFHRTANQARARRTPTSKEGELPWETSPASQQLY